MRSVDFHFLALDADVGDPVLTATVGASGYVQLQVLIETGQTLFQFFDQPAREALGFGDGELAEFRAAAGDCAARESRPADFKPIASSSFAKRSALIVGTFTTSRFCMLVARSSPPANRSARSAAACICSAVMRPRRATAPT